MGKMMVRGCLFAAMVLALSCGVHSTLPDIDPSTITGDVNDLIEMIPCDQLAAMFFEYLSSDTQVNKVLRYLTSDSFKANLVLFETSPSFHKAYDSLMPLGVDLYQWTNELNRLLDIATVKPAPVLSAGRRRRAPGDGVLGMVKDALVILPLADMKEAYNHKLDTNPHFERMMDHLLTMELRNHIYTLMSSPQFEDVTRQLNEMNVPISEIVDLVEELVVDFFDLESKEEDDDDEVEE